MSCRWQYGFNLRKSEFRDRTNYGTKARELCKTCSFGHDCPCSALHSRWIYTYATTKSGPPANFINDVYHDVDIQPLLQRLQGGGFDYKSTTREDNRASGLWGHRLTRCFFDVKIFDPLAKTSKTSDPCKCHEILKTNTSNVFWRCQTEQHRSTSFLGHWWRCSWCKNIATPCGEDWEKNRDHMPRPWITSEPKLALLFSVARYFVWGAVVNEKERALEISFGAIIEEGRL